jgi:hypothetical protein
MEETHFLQRIKTHIDRLMFSENVFINCPFDKEYSILLRALIFTVRVLGLTPILALNSTDCSRPRLEKIKGMLKNSKYGIHDISRMRTQDGNLARMNMPFELGFDFGLKEALCSELGQKEFLILESQKYDYQKALSDLAGHDIFAHNDEVYDLIKITRNWFVENGATTKRFSPNIIWSRFIDFCTDIYDIRGQQGFLTEDERNEMPINEIIENLNIWISKQNVSTLKPIEEQVD